MTRTAGNTPAATDELEPLLIPSLIEDMQTEGVDGGVNYHMLHVNVLGLPVMVQAYLNMREGDRVEVFWGDDSVPVASGTVLPENIGQDFGLFIAALDVPDGISSVHYSVTRVGGNEEFSAPLVVLVRTDFPGGTDPEPEEPGHQRLPPPAPQLPPNGIIDEEAAKNGVRVIFDGYPNMRVYDVITFSWGGELLVHKVTQDEVDAGTLEILVSEAVILKAGDSDSLVLVYRVRDEVHNQSSDWSPRTLVMVEVGSGLFAAPLVENPDPAADPFDVIDLDVLGEEDLLVLVYAAPGGDLLVGDVVSLTWLGTTAQGEPVPVTLPDLTVLRLPISLRFFVPNANLLPLGRGRAVASYRVTRDDSPAGASKRSFVTFLGVEQRLPKPTVAQAEDGFLDPTLGDATLVVPGEALGAGDTVQLTWLGTRANGTPLLREFERGISGGGAGKPLQIPISGADLIAPLEGGTVVLYYRLITFAGLELDSEREQLSVGETRADLPAPSTRPAAEDGVLDPETITAQLQLVVTPWPGMQAGQTLYLDWRASSGPGFADCMPISVPMEGREVVFYLDREHVEANLGARIDLDYQVEIPGEPTRRSEIATFDIAAGHTVLPLPLILEADGDRLDLDQVLQGASVYIDASANLQADDLVTVQIVSSAEGGSIALPWTVPTGEAGQPATITVPYDTLEASVGLSIGLHYSITRAAGGQVELSGTVGYSLYREIGSGPLRVMGARFNAGVWLPARQPRMLSALHEHSLAPMAAQWRYEDEPQWTSASSWIDDKPWLKLYVRNASETWECRPVNLCGNGYPNTVAAFAAMRDEVAGADGPEVDIVAWGNTFHGGRLPPEVADLDDVAQICSSGFAFAARLRSGGVACWGELNALVEGDYVQVASDMQSFVGCQRNGELFAWGHHQDPGVPVPPPVLQYRDYIEVYGASVAFAARRATGHVVAWGDAESGGLMKPGQDRHDDVVAVASTTGAFAALRNDGASRCVFAWGASANGGDMPDSITHLVNVKRLFAAGTAFCILLDSGEVKAWPDTIECGDIPDDIAQLDNIVEVTATWEAFCARLSTGEIVAWGKKDWGGELSPEAGKATNVIQVSATAQAFAALCSDGTVIAWGNPAAGGDASKVADRLTGVRAIYASSKVFTALTRTGEVVTWGDPFNGGDSDEVQPELRGKVSHSRLLTAAEAYTHR